MTQWVVAFATTYTFTQLFVATNPRSQINNCVVVNVAPVPGSALLLI